MSGLPCLRMLPHLPLRHSGVGFRSNPLTCQEIEDPWREATCPESHGSQGGLLRTLNPRLAGVMGRGEAQRVFWKRCFRLGATASVSQTAILKRTSQRRMGTRGRHSACRGAWPWVCPRKPAPTSAGALSFTARHTLLMVAGPEEKHGWHPSPCSTWAFTVSFLYLQKYWEIDGTGLVDPAASRRTRRCWEAE